MGETTKISWCDATFNPWIGCAKVSPGCQHCYAERENIRYGRPNLWGPNSTRQRTSQAYWKQPLKWDKAARLDGVRKRVFSGSWCDVMESGAYLDGIRKDLYELIWHTPHLDWLLLTKRPQNFLAQFPADWLHDPLPNVWLGTTAEDQAHADERIPWLLDVPAKLHFVSIEPMLGPIDIASFVRLDWVIVGGETGPAARPADPDWVRNLRDQCISGNRVPFFFKQWGEYCHWSQTTDEVAQELGSQPDGPIRLGKEAAGCLLDGREWKEIPEAGRCS